MQYWNTHLEFCVYDIEKKNEIWNSSIASILIDASSAGSDY